MAWRTYKQFWQHQKLSKFHFFPKLATGTGEHYTALCGKVAQGDYIQPGEPRPEMRERFYCKRCRTLYGKQQAAS
jgi:hypothetical protein